MFLADAASLSSQAAEANVADPPYSTAAKKPDTGPATAAAPSAYLPTGEEYDLWGHVNEPEEGQSALLELEDDAIDHSDPPTSSCRVLTASMSCFPQRRAWWIEASF